MITIHFIGIDVHKETVSAAVACNEAEPESIGKYTNDTKGLRKLKKKLDEYKKTGEVKIVYEAGPTGYVLKRELEKSGFSCEIAAPSLIPKKPGERIKTDRKDAIKLARYYRSGDLTMILCPTEEQESVRNLTRIRQDFVEDIRRTKNRINHFLLKLDKKYPVRKSKWGVAHMNWLRSLEFENESDEYVLKEYMAEYENLKIRLQKMTRKIEETAQTDEYKKKVEVLCAYYGISTLTAMTLITEIIDFRRFKNPRQLMAYLGLVPSERTSGNTKRQGSITKAGNTHARRCIIEASWTAVRARKHSPKTMRQLEKIPTEFHPGPMRANERLKSRYYRLLCRKKLSQVAIVAVAREYIGFIWYSMTLLENRSAPNFI